MATTAWAQQPAPAAPSFASPDLSASGARSMAASCGACHGTRGVPVAGSPVEPLAGRPAAQIVQAMAQFKAGTRPATLMHQISKGYSDAEVAAIAEYFSAQTR